MLNEKELEEYEDLSAYLISLRELSPEERLNRMEMHWVSFILNHYGPESALKLIQQVEQLV